MPGRKKKELTTEQITQLEDLVASGLGVMDCCRALDISWDTFNKLRQKSEISDAIKKGTARGRSIIVSSLFENAKKGNTVAQIFWLKNKGGEGEWQDRQEQQININLKDVIDNAQQRIAQHNDNTRVIEGESVDITGLADQEQQTTNKKSKNKGDN